MKTRTKANLKYLAQEMRKNPTEAEDLLWQELRNRKLDGIKFRRQEPIGDYIVDFISFEKNIIIEVDGRYHLSRDQSEYDKNRSDYLKFNDAIILRFWNEEVINDIEKVLRKISDVCMDR